MQQVLLGGRLLAQHAEAVAGDARLNLAPGRHRLPIAALSLGRSHQPGEVDASGSDQRDIRRAVAMVKVIAHCLNRKSPMLFAVPSTLCPSGCEPKYMAPGLVVGAERRLILIHLDFFEDHLLFRVEIRLAERRAAGCRPATPPRES